MQPQTRFQKSLFHNGQSITVVTKTGSTCPCMTYRDSSKPEYNPGWHRDNPAAAACNGTGIISVTTTSTPAKANVMPFLVAINSAMIRKELLDKIGEIQNDDLCLIGTVKVSDGTFIDLSTLVEKKDYITYNSHNYLVRHTFDYGTTEVVGQIAILKRKA